MPVDEHVEETKDELAPELTVSGLHECGLLVGEEQLQIEATDDGGIAKIEVFMDSKLLGTLCAAPYEVNINSTTYTDGEYELEVHAFDTAGNQQEWKQMVKISNVLITVDALKRAEALASWNEEGYIVASNKLGNILSSAKIENGKADYHFNAPDGFYDSHIVFSYISKDLDDVDLYVTSTNHVEGGIHWVFGLEDDLEEEPQNNIGTAGYSIYNFTSENEYMLLTGADGSYRSSFSNENEGVIELYAEPTTLLVKKKNFQGEDYTYRLVKNVNVGSHFSLDAKALVVSLMNFQPPFQRLKSMKFMEMLFSWHGR